MLSRTKNISQIVGVSLLTLTMSLISADANAQRRGGGGGGGGHSSGGNYGGGGSHGSVGGGGGGGHSSGGNYSGGGRSGGGYSGASGGNRSSGGRTGGSGRTYGGGTGRGTGNSNSGRITNNGNGRTPGRTGGSFGSSNRNSGNRNIGTVNRNTSFSRTNVRNSGHFNHTAINRTQNTYVHNNNYRNSYYGRNGYRNHDYYRNHYYGGWHGYWGRWHGYWGAGALWGAYYNPWFSYGFYGGYYYPLRPCYGIYNYFWSPLVAWYYADEYDAGYYRDLYVGYKVGVWERPSNYVPVYYPTEPMKELLVGVGAMPKADQTYFQKGMKDLQGEIAQTLANALHSEVVLKKSSVIVTNYQAIGNPDTATGYTLDGAFTYSHNQYAFKALIFWNATGTVNTMLFMPITADGMPAKTPALATAAQAQKLADMNAQIKAMGGTTLAQEVEPSTESTPETDSAAESDDVSAAPADPAVEDSDEVIVK